MKRDTVSRQPKPLWKFNIKQVAEQNKNKKPAIENGYE